MQAWSRPFLNNVLSPEHILQNQTHIPVSILLFLFIYFKFYQHLRVIFRNSQVFPHNYGNLGFHGKMLELNIQWFTWKSKDLRWRQWTARLCGQRRRCLRRCRRDVDGRKESWKIIKAWKWPRFSRGGRRERKSKGVCLKEREREVEGVSECVGEKESK